MSTHKKGERVAKAIARAGICSRREAERLIAQGRVALDGTRLDSPAVNVTAQARITIDGKPLPAPAPAGLWRYHKPKGTWAKRSPSPAPAIARSCSALLWIPRAA